MVPDFQSMGFQMFLQKSVDVYPAVAGPFQSDAEMLMNVCSGIDERVSTLWLALVAVGRMQGIAIALHDNYMVYFFADVAIVITRKLHALDMSLGTA